LFSSSSPKSAKAPASSHSRFDPNSFQFVIRQSSCRRCYKAGFLRHSQPLPILRQCLCLAKPWVTNNDRHKKHKSACKGKAVPLQAWSGPEGSRKLRFPDSMTTA
jgi:hypothetical protein